MLSVCIIGIDVQALVKLHTEVADELSSSSSDSSSSSTTVISSSGHDGHTLLADEGNIKATIWGLCPSRLLQLLLLSLSMVTVTIMIFLLLFATCCVFLFVD